jgi:hypothetical protein
MGGGAGGSAPQQPPFNPIKITGEHGIANKALNQDIRRYMSYQFPVFPGLSAVRQSEIEDAYRQLTGPLSPEFQNDFMQKATVGSQAVTGGGDPFSGMAYQKGSFAKGSQSASFTRETLAKQDYDRARMEGLMQANPVPGLGLSQNDIMSMFVYNTGAQNTWNMGNYANQVAGANADYASQVSMGNNIGNLISGLGSIYSNYQMNNVGGTNEAAAFGG